MADSQLQSELTERVTTMLRRDLRLGPDAKIEDDTPLMGGDFALDSLDMVMLVTSVEKEFGIKIADARDGSEAFKTVGTLVAFIQSQESQPTAAGATPKADATEAGADDAGQVDLAQLLAGLPHGEPFRFVTRLTDLTPMQQGCGEWELSGSESFFAGHFPERPIVPGVLISEALAQLSGLVGVSAGAAGPQSGELAHVDVRFRRAVAPPATLVMHSRLSGTVAPVQHFEVRAECEGQVVAEGRLSLKRGDAQS